MSSQSEVKVVADDGIKNQFGRGAFYRSPVQNSKPVRNVCIFGFVGAVIILVFTGSPEPAHEPQSALLFTGELHSQAPIDLPNHDVVQAEREREAANAPKSVPMSKGPREKFTGPKLVTPSKGIHIPPGTMVQAVLISGGSNGLVKAQLKEPVTVNGETVIEDGATLVGQGSSTEERLMIRFTKAIMRDAAVESIQAQAADFEDKIVGLNGSRVGHYAAKLAAAVGLNFVTGMSEGLQDTQAINGVAVRAPTLKNSLYNGTAMAASEQAQELLSSVKNKQPIVEVPAGRPLWVIFDDSGS